jgi:hypothetical protein
MVGEAASGVRRMGKIEQSILLLREKHIDFFDKTSWFGKNQYNWGKEEEEWKENEDFV